MIPKTFRTAKEGALINYSFSDIAVGFGVINMEAYATTSSGAVVTKAITSNTVTYPGDPKFTPSTGDAVVGYTKIGEVSFDNSPNNYLTKISGIGLVDVSWNIDRTGVTTAIGYIIAKIQVVNSGGTVVSTAGSVQSREQTITAPGFGTTTTEQLQIDCTSTNIIPGNSLRLTIEMWGKVPSGIGNSIIKIAHTPANVDTDNFTAATNHTYLKWQVPFKIDL